MFGKHTCSGGTSNIDVNLTLDLTDYVKTEDLTEYIKTIDLSDYVKTEDLTDYAKKDDLTDYVKTEDLDLTDYAKKDDETFTGTTTIDTLAITDSNTTILGESGQLHFDNNDGYYAFHINSYPYLYVTADSCYVNNTLSIDTNEKQIVFYRENNFWYFNTENNGTKLQIKSGTSLSNWNENAFEFYHNGNFKIPGTCESNGIYNTSTLHQGGDASFYDNIISFSLNNQFQIMNTNNFWYFNAPAYSTQATTNKLMLWPRYSASHPQVEGFGFFQNGDFNAPGIVYAENGVTNSGVLTQYGVSNFSGIVNFGDVVNSEQTIICRNDMTATGNIHYGNAMVPIYDPDHLPAFTLEQIGGSAELIFPNGTYLPGYNYRSVELPIGYYLVIGHLEVTPDTYNNDYMEFGISTTSNLVNSPYSRYYSFHSTHKDTFDLMHYIANNNVTFSNTNFYYYIFNASTEVEVTSSKCTFIRIA